MSIPMDLCSTEDHGHHLLVMRRLVNETTLYALVTHWSRVRTVKAWGIDDGRDCSPAYEDDNELAGFMRWTRNVLSL